MTTQFTNETLNKLQEQFKEIRKSQIMLASSWVVISKTKFVLAVDVSTSSWIRKACSSMALRLLTVTSTSSKRTTQLVYKRAVTACVACSFL